MHPPSAFKCSSHKYPILATSKVWRVPVRTVLEIGAIFYASVNVGFRELGLMWKKVK